MKRRISVPLIAALLIGCLIFTACGGSSAASSSAAPSARPAYAAAQEQQDMAYDSETATENAGLNGDGTTATTATDVNRKIIRNAWLVLETKEFDEALTALNALVVENGGYLQSQNVSGRSIYRTESYYSREASMVARIPADRLDAVMNATAGICNVLSREISSDDITDTYFDSEAHLRALTVQEERLLEILSQAEKLEDIIVLERALTDVRYQIEALTASLRRMDQQVSYSTLQLELSEVVDYHEPVAQPKSLGDRLAASWKRSINRVSVIAEGLLILAIEALPTIVIFLVLPLMILLLIARIFRKSRGHRPPPSSSPTPPASTKYARPTFIGSNEPAPPTPPTPTETTESATPENKEE